MTVGWIGVQGQGIGYLMQNLLGERISIAIMAASAMRGC